VKIATWNVNGMRARLEFLLAWLRERRPDVVGLQELKLTEDRFPLSELEAEGYQAVIHGQKAWNGVAILSRGEATLVRKGLPGHEESGARLLTARIGDLSFTTVYCPNGKHVGHEDFPRKLLWFEGLARLFHEEHSAKRPAVLCGDFNICPAPIDSFNEEALRGTIFHTEEERARFRRLIDWGFRDLFREKFPDAQEYSWWDYRGGAFHRRQGLRLDLLLGTGSVMDRVRSVEIDREYRKKKEGLTPSDHAPVIAELL
jgi:exodeoxyribonuclease-3